MLVEGRRSARGATPVEVVEARNDDVAGVEEHDVGVEVAATIAADVSRSPTPASVGLRCRSQALVVRFLW